MIVINAKKQRENKKRQRSRKDCQKKETQVIVIIANQI